MRETTARSRYHGLLTALKIEGGRAGTRYAQLHAEPQPDRCDQRSRRDRHPAEPARIPMRDYADARTDRRHIFNGILHLRTAVLPQRRARCARRCSAAGRSPGIVNIAFGPAGAAHVGVDQQLPPRWVRRPASGDIDGRRRSSSTACRTGSIRMRSRRRPTARSATPAARRSASRAVTSGTSRCRRTSSPPTSACSSAPISSTRSTSGSGSPIRLPNGLDNTCTVSVTSCTVATDRFGQILDTRAPREIQLGLKVYW